MDEEAELVVPEPRQTLLLGGGTFGIGGSRRSRLGDDRYTEQERQTGNEQGAGVFSHKG